MRHFCLTTGLMLLCYTTIFAQKIADDVMFKHFQDAQTEFSNFERQHGNFLQTKNVNMHYLSWGNPFHPALIWLHGSLNNGYEMLPFADSLVKAGFYLIAPDYYGHGQTPVPDQEKSLYHLADDIKELMDHLSIKKAFIGGFSRGAYAATAFYDSYPDHTLGLILEDGGSVAFNTTNHQLSTEELLQKAKSFNQQAPAPWDSGFVTAFDAYKTLYESTEEGNQFQLMALIRKNTTPKWSIVYADLMPLFHMQNSSSFLELVLKPTKAPLFARSMVNLDPEMIFRNLHVPLLILDPVSKQDPMPFEKENAALQQQHPNWIRHLIYQDTEHNIHYAQPEKFLQDVLSFLAEHHLDSAKTK